MHEKAFRLFKHVVIRRLKYQLNNPDSFGNQLTLEIYKTSHKTGNYLKSEKF